MTLSSQPGRVNAHTHLYSGLAPLGLPEPSPAPRTFPELLARKWWRLDRALDERSLRAAARHYVAHALLAGTTTIVDHHESPCFIEGSLDVLADVCDELGVRALLCYGATERNGGRAEAARGLAECARLARRSLPPTVRVLVGLHACFTVSDATIQDAARLCRDLDTALHVHVAEDRCDVEDARARGYAGPVERLIALEALVPGSVLAHGVHLARDDVARVADLGAWLVQNPRSNEANRVGYPSAIGASPLVALGTDGFPSDLSEEAGALAALAPAHGEAPEVAERRLDAGRSLVERHFGSEALADDIARTEGGRVVDVVIGGRDVVRSGRLLTGDLEAIDAEARAAAPALFSRMTELES